MKIVYSWLLQLCPTELAPEELAELLTAKGAEVEGIERPWERLSRVVVARVLEVRDHPSSETLCLARIDTGSGEREVVAGVRNMAPGDLVPFAPPGATVPALEEPLSVRSIRGVESGGMLCSAMELAIAQSHEGILVLPETMHPGEDLKAALGLDEAVLDIEVTPNRPDFLSVLGIAREVAAATGAPLIPPSTEPPEAQEKAGGVATVEIRDLERCPRYLARIVRDVRHVPSPIGVQARLSAAGMRPISAVVDATNYAMLELGQPLHPFDLSLLSGPGIVVRRAGEGEDLTTLDGVERRLTADDLVIADLERPVAVAGVMGGSSSEVSEQTTDILLESASFERRGVQRTRRRLGLSTEASMRFERGADPEVVPGAADRAAGLMAEWCGARVLAGSIEAGEAPARRRVSMRPSRASAVLGFEVRPDEATAVLDRLRMVHEDRPDRITVEIPGYRVDIEREVDLIEEVVRILGYDRVRSCIPAIRQTGGEPPGYRFRQRVRDSMAAAGLAEIISPSFASAADVDMTADAPQAVEVANPLDAEQAYLRTRLMPGLLRALGRNAARNVPSAALFEVGSVFRVAPDGVQERFKAAFAMTGVADPGWSGRGRPFDVFDAKGTLELVLARLGVEWVLDDLAPAPFHPGRGGLVAVGGRPVGAFGEIHPRVSERFGLPGRVALGELELGALLDASVDAELRLADLPRFPPVRRDLSFVVPQHVPAGVLRAKIVEAGGELVGSCELFDVFTGGQIGEGSKSLTFAVEIRAPDRTLTDEEADAVIARIVERVAVQVGGRLRKG